MSDQDKIELQKTVNDFPFTKHLVIIVNWGLLWAVLRIARKLSDKHIDSLVVVGLCIVSVYLFYIGIDVFKAAKNAGWTNWDFLREVKKIVTEDVVEHKKFDYRKLAISSAIVFAVIKLIL